MIAVAFAVIITLIVAGVGVGVILTITGNQFNRHGFGHAQAERSARWQEQQKATYRAEVDNYWDRITAKHQKRVDRVAKSDKAPGLIGHFLYSRSLRKLTESNKLRNKEHRILNIILEGKGGKAGGDVHPQHGHTLHGIRRAGTRTERHGLKLPDSATRRIQARPAKKNRFIRFITK